MHNEVANFNLNICIKIQNLIEIITELTANAGLKMVIEQEFSWHVKHCKLRLIGNVRQTTRIQNRLKNFDMKTSKRKED